ncbi:MAG TPA: response regulator [Rhodothermales bacterium]|nr:response regulator [Rhodothermales bacterium]
MANLPRILWADDEIELLKPHVLFLESKGYDVVGVTNGVDAVEKVREERFDLVFLDEQMPGMGGLEALSEIKASVPDIPVVMITKSEEESLMEDAIGGQIADYLIKPVKPNQILLTCKKLLDARVLKEEKAAQTFLQSFGRISATLNDELSHETWAEVYQELVRYDLQLEGDDGARQILDEQLRSAQTAFGRWVEANYEDWIEYAHTPPDEHRPVLSHEVMPQWVFPLLQEKKPIFFLLIDCMRYDQWLEFERLLYPLFDMEKNFHYAILPTATPYARNAIFSGLLPIDMAKRFPSQWADAEENENSKNLNEELFLQDLLKRHRLSPKTRYEKIINGNEGRELLKNIRTYAKNDLSAIVVNFVDILAHSRSDSNVLKEIAPDERAYRALTRTWFAHSWLFQIFQELAELDCNIIVTSDHGAVRSLHDTKVIGDRSTSTSLRYKHGRNLKADTRHAIFIKDPKRYGLPQGGINTNYIIAKEDYYFVYPTNYHHYQHQYWDTFQHGGASLQEMILPVIRMKPKK